MSKLVKASILLLSLFIAGCSTQSGIAGKSGLARTFNATYADTKAATRYSVETLNVKIARIEDAGSAYTIWFSKPMSAWSWGEQGLVTVSPLAGESTKVEVRSAKNYKLQVSGTGQEKFAGAIFEGIEKGLRDLGK